MTRRDTARRGWAGFWRRQGRGAAWRGRAGADRPPRPAAGAAPGSLHAARRCPGALGPVRPRAPSGGRGTQPRRPASPARRHPAGPRNRQGSRQAGPDRAGPREPRRAQPCRSGGTAAREKGQAQTRPRQTRPHQTGREETGRTEKPAAAAASAPKTSAKASGGAQVSVQSYARAVMKKVRATKKRSGAGHGTVVVGFTVARDGGLAGVKVLQSSGNAALDRAAQDHIRRSAPFPPPPEGAGRRFSFEFVGK
ncbi:MAG: energy transducer TonB [Paracoccaceae bacterium]